ncbi:MAG: glycosyltransferase family 39 protein [Elusimicrobia bacterium]|nr:glycosyltransferase family 39 protein [Elusimicrobiota bacterium]
MSVPTGAPERRAAVDPVLLVCLAAAAALLLWNLGGRDLWQDEGETAMLAKNILRFKLPVVFDGVNLVSTEAGMDSGPDRLWRWSPWLQFYAAAGGMAVFGSGTAAARLPFALLGLLCLPLTYLLALRAFASRRIARLSAVLLALSVPFLLHCRQARWYALAYAAAAGIFLSLFGLERRPRAAAAALAASAVLLFYSNYFVAIGLLASVCLAAFLLRPAARTWKALAAAMAAAGLGAAPGLGFFHVLDKAPPLSLHRTADFLAAYAGAFSSHLLPLPMAALSLWLLFKKDSLHSADPEPRKRALFLLAVCACFIGYLALGPWMLFRYLTVLLPACAALLAWALDRAWAWNRAAGATLFLLLAGTDVLHRVPLGPFSSPLAGFLHEITHDLADCSRPLVEKLKAEARPTDVVLTTYGDSPLQFYTGLKVVGGFQGLELPAAPDWVVLRATVLDPRPGRDYDTVRFILDRIDLKGSYEPVDLPCSDLMLAGCTEPQFHLFRAPAEARKMKVYRLRRGRRAAPPTRGLSAPR